MNICIVIDNIFPSHGGIGRTTERFSLKLKERGHKIIPSASLIPENDPSSLFTTAGMQPLVPYLMGQNHPGGKRVVNVQKCVRTGDIDDVGDNRHLTFFEMLGNWSFGNYFKLEAINWSYEFLTNKDEGLGLDPQRLYVTTFKGEENIPRDEESISVWQAVFKKNKLTHAVAGDSQMIDSDVRIIPLGKADNFWIAGQTGPCGADTEIFYDILGDNGNKLKGEYRSLIMLKAREGTSRKGIEIPIINCPAGATSVDFKIGLDNNITTKLIIISYVS